MVYKVYLVVYRKGKEGEKGKKWRGERERERLLLQKTGRQRKSGHGLGGRQEIAEEGSRACL